MTNITTAKEIGKGLFYVTNQNGLKNVLASLGWSKSTCLHYNGYPSSYPAIISICKHGPGDMWFSLKSVSLHEINKEKNHDNE